MKFINSFFYAIAGIKSCFVSEANFRIHIVTAFVAIVVSLVLGISATEWIAIGVCIAFVITMEMINTAVEKLCDLVNKEVHPTIKQVKDVAAGAVFVAAVFSLIIGCAIFLPKIIMHLKK
jgi:diacylglycerol kinase